MKTKILTTLIASLFTVNVYAYSDNYVYGNNVITNIHDLEKVSVDEIATLGHMDNVKNVTSQYGGNLLLHPNSGQVQTVSNRLNQTENYIDSISIADEVKYDSKTILVHIPFQSKDHFNELATATIGTTAAIEMPHHRKGILMATAALTALQLLNEQYYTLKTLDTQTIGDYLDTHPERMQLVENIIQYKLSQARKDNNTLAYEQLMKLLDDLNFNERSRKAQEALETQNEDWQNIYKEVLEKIAETRKQMDDNGQTPNCSDSQRLAIFEALIDTPNQFNTNIAINALTNPHPFVLQQKQSDYFYVNSYIVNYNMFESMKTAKLAENESKEQDHIPSYAAIETYFIKEEEFPLNLPKKYRNNKDGTKTEIIGRHENLANNLTTIMINTSLHKRGRTWGQLNSVEQITKDSQDLLIATAKDIATMIYRIKYAYLVTETRKKRKVDIQPLNYENNQSEWERKSNEYLESSMTIYKRNRYLCLYYNQEK